jgi:hypothetical protein
MPAHAASFAPHDVPPYALFRLPAAPVAAPPDGAWSDRSWRHYRKNVAIDGTRN